MRKLKIYLGGSIYGGRDFEDGLKLIARVAKELGHDVLTDDFVVNVDLTEKEGTYTGVVERDVTKLNLADVFIAEVSQASHGVGYEDAVADGDLKPALKLRHHTLNGENRHSSFLEGTVVRNPNSRFAYYSPENIKEILQGFFEEFFGEDDEPKLFRVKRERAR